jgi:DNA-directed RNA polymerase alpha subunit
MPPGWVIAVILPREEKDEPDESRIGTLPVVALYSNGDVIEPVVALNNGTVTRASMLEHEVLCMASPEEDVQKVAKLALALRMEPAPQPNPDN